MAGMVLIASLTVAIAFSVAIKTDIFSWISGVNKAEVDKVEKVRLSAALNKMANIYRLMSIIATLEIAVLICFNLYQGSYLGLIGIGYAVIAPVILKQKTRKIAITTENGD